MATTSVTTERDADTHATRYPDASEPVEAVLAELGQAMGALRCAGSQRLLRLGLSMTHFHVLTLLRHHDAMPMGRLAEMLDASVSSTTGIVDRMVERGLVERVRVPDDRRVVLVRPTDAGEALVDDVELVRNDTLAAALGRLPRVRLDRFAAAVADLRDALAAEIASDPDRYDPARHGREHGSDPSFGRDHGSDARRSDPGLGRQGHPSDRPAGDPTVATATHS